MKKIFYGLSGEGLGHTTRTLAIIDKMPEYEFHLFTYGKAYEFLRKTQYPHLHRIDGLMFSYKNNRVDYIDLTKRAFGFFTKGIRKNIQYIVDQGKIHNPSLCIADFEPSIARAAKKMHAPLVSVDNQHRFAYVDLVDLPFSLRMYGWLCGTAAKFLVPCPDKTVISTFHYDSIEPRGDNVEIANSLFRTALENIAASNNGHVLVYVRDSVSEKVLESIQSLKCPVIVYGASPTKLIFGENVRFKQLSPQFVFDLLSCDRVISTAGNQLLGEIRYLNKHCLCIPEPGQYEQHINGVYAERLGFGKMCLYKDLSKELVEDYVNMELTEVPAVENGVHKVVSILRGMLSHEINQESVHL